MSGIFTSKTLAAGHLANTLSVLYQTPSANVTYVRSMYISSNNANTQEIRLYKNCSGLVLNWATFTLNQGEMADIVDAGALNLSANDSILAQTNLATTNAATFTIHGVEEK